MKLTRSNFAVGPMHPGTLALAVTLVFVARVAAQEKLTGRIHVDGSSTVAPITMAAAELFQAEQPRVRVTVGISGTGGGFKKFLDVNPDLRTDINDASRPIKNKEVELAAKLGVEYIEIPVAIDGLAVLVHPGNTFCDHLTVEELKQIWKPGSGINNWKQVRQGFPDLPLQLYGPGTDSGTFDYFTEAIVGEEKASRSDYTASESDNVLVMGIGGDAGSLGYFGYSYYAANKAKLKLLAIDNNDGKPVLPTIDVIRKGTYRPLSRPLFLYVNRASADRAEVRGYVEFILKNGPMLVEHPKVNYVSLTPELYASGQRRLSDRVTGSAMAGAHESGATELSEIFGR